MNEPEVIFEDEAVLVINKPAGLIVHSDGRTKERSVSEWLVEHYPALKGVGEPWRSPQGELIDRPGIVHRLDRMTSGVMIVAKTQEAYMFLKHEFQKREVAKTYRAYVYGYPKEDRGIITAGIERVRAKPPRWSAFMRGNKTRRAAVTEWEVLKRGIDEEIGEKVTEIITRPKTGRTHQIRVHLQAIHHPIVCDPLYAKGRTCLLGFSRPALHAESLHILLPSGVQKTFRAELPIDFLAAETLLKE